MARTVVDTYFGFDREEAVVEIPVPFAYAGRWHAEIRARLVDDKTQDWFFEVGYNIGAGENRIDIFPVDWVRRPGLTDVDGIVPPEVLARMRLGSPEAE
jgi:hypothetical protein